MPLEFREPDAILLTILKLCFKHKQSLFLFLIDFTAAKIWLDFFVRAFAVGVVVVS